MEWKDREGNIHKIEEMDTNHIINAMRFVKNRIDSVESVLSLSPNGNSINYQDKMKIKYLKESLESFKIELRERRLKQLINKDQIDDLDNIGLDL